MPVEMSVWRIDGAHPRRLTAAVLPSEKALEDFLAQDPSLLGTRLLVIGRQVRAPYGKLIDLLAIDGEGNLHVLELKRDKTPRDVVAQVLDYGSWVSTLGRDDVIELASQHLSEPFEAAFEDAFGSPPPDELNGELQLTVVATNLDDSSERIVTYLRGFNVPINAIFFSYLEDGDRSYLARSWLAPTDERSPQSGRAPKSSKRADWNGRDWFVSFGDGLRRSWEDGRTYGFVSAGGEVWYSRTLRSLPVGARVNVHIPGLGYIAVGVTLAEAVKFDDAQVLIDNEWEPLAAQELHATYAHGLEGEAKTDDNAEYVVPVRWITSIPKDQAFWEKGMFANQNSACKLRQEFTLERIATHFGIDSKNE